MQRHSILVIAAFPVLTNLIYDIVKEGFKSSKKCFSRLQSNKQFCKSHDNKKRLTPLLIGDKFTLVDLNVVLF